MTHEQFVSRMRELNARLAKANRVEELKALQKEIAAVLAAPRI